VCTSKVYMTTNCKSTVWGGTNYTTALSNWNTNSNSYVSLSDTTNIGESKIDFSLATLPMLNGNYVFGQTFDYDTSGDCYVTNAQAGDYTGTWNSNFDGVVTYSQIYLNNSNAPAAAILDRYILAHEMGHSLGLGHTTSESIVYCSVPTESQWTDVDKPQAHDRTDLASWY
jgi:hypothetical protein